MDIIGKKLGIRACDLLGGALREEVPFASYLFFRHPDPVTGKGGEETAGEMAAMAVSLAKEHGFTSHKLKAGVFHPDYEMEVFRAISEALPGTRLQIGRASCRERVCQ